MDLEATETDPTMLMEMMEVREELEEANDDALHALHDQNETKIRTILGELDQLFRGDELNESAVVSLVNRLSYLDKIRKEIHSRLPAA